MNYLLGLSHYKNRNLEKAMHYALRAVELDGTGDAYLTLLAKLYTEDGDDKAAESYAQAAFTRNPANWEAALVLAKMAFEKNDLPAGAGTRRSGGGAHVRNLSRHLRLKSKDLPAAGRGAGYDSGIHRRIREIRL
ncbi:MAG: hypothetical protein V9E84_03035 [Trichococcus flocculiformis]